MIEIHQILLNLSPMIYSGRRKKMSLTLGHDLKSLNSYFQRGLKKSH